MDTQPGIVTPVRFRTKLNDMGKFKFVKDFGIVKAGDVAQVADHHDGFIIRKGYGKKMEDQAPENKMIKKAPKNK